MTVQRHTPEEALNLYSNAITHLEEMRDQLGTAVRRSTADRSKPVRLAFSVAALEWLHQRVCEILAGKECRGGKDQIMELTLNFFAEAMERELFEKGADVGREGGAEK